MDEMTKGKEISLRVGSGTQRGEVSVSTFLPESLTLRVSYKGGQAAAVVLTEEQVRQLRRALDEVAPQAEVRNEEKLRLAA
jgi:hypothetical protein